MCGRFTLFGPPESLQEEFDLATLPILDERYNIAPTQDVFAIIQAEHKRRAGYLKWGLIPSWSKDATFCHKLINARAETIDSKPSFKRAFERRRCIIPASGFYEWMKLDEGKQPHFIFPTTMNFFAFAGLWEKWIDEQNHPTYSCTIITTESNELMAPLHHRMPVILSKDSYSTWLDSNTEIEHVRDLLLPFPSEQMETRPVSTIVNSTRNETDECIAPFSGS
ncbi:SOS response-associated peptidase [bacterium LRH843]|nr:SOS response-associated peptidase [bacterium LRH843]